jgi:hypothetical protein
VDLQDGVLEVVHHTVAETQEVVHNHGVARVVVVDPDAEAPGVVGHLLVEKRLDSHEVLVGLEGDLLPSVQVVGL